MSKICVPLYIFTHNLCQCISVYIAPMNKCVFACIHVCKVKVFWFTVF